jgi:hypothetical protein
VFNAQGLVCGCVNRARKFTPHARVMYLERRRVKTHMTQVWINIARCKHARAICFGEGRGPIWPFGMEWIRILPSKHALISNPETTKKCIRLVHEWSRIYSDSWVRTLLLLAGFTPLGRLAFGTHHVDGGVWNDWVCAYANHTRPTRGTRRGIRLVNQ